MSQLAVGDPAGDHEALHYGLEASRTVLVAMIPVSLVHGGS